MINIFCSVNQTLTNFIYLFFYSDFFMNIRELISEVELNNNRKLKNTD